MGYAATKPIDKNGTPMQDSGFVKPALQRYAPENSSASSVLTLTVNTTAVEVAAVTTAAVAKWITTSDTTASVISIAGGTANFDYVIPLSQVRTFIVPQEGVGTGAQSIAGIGTQLGLYRRLAIKSIGVGSVLTSEFGG